MFFKKILVFFIVFLLFSSSLAGKRMVFKEVVVQPGDTYENLFQENWDIVAHINRIDKKSLKPGIKLKVPLDLFLIKENENSILAENWKYEKKVLFEYPFFPKYLVWEAKTPNLILVVLDKQFLGCYKYGYLQFTCPISTAGEGYKMPIGRFEVFYKSVYHVSTLYGDPMPWTLSFTKYHAIHGGPLPGYPDSHGCVRTFLRLAKRIYKECPLKTIVLPVPSLRCP